MLGNKHLGNERIYRNRMFAKTPIEIQKFRKFEETTHSNERENALTLKGFPLFAHWRGSLNKMENVWVCSGGFSYAIQELPDKKNRYRTHRFAIRAISVFRVKFNVEFTRQAAGNFSILYR